MCLHEGFRLLAFVVASTLGDQMSASPVTSVQKHGEETAPPPPAKHHHEEAGGADGGLSRLILSQLSQLLPAHCLPDTLVLVPALCQTPHGERHTLRRCIHSLFQPSGT